MPYTQLYQGNSLAFRATLRVSFTNDLPCEGKRLFCTSRSEQYSDKSIVSRPPRRTRRRLTFLSAIIPNESSNTATVAMLSFGRHDCDECCHRILQQLYSSSRRQHQEFYQARYLHYGAFRDLNSGSKQPAVSADRSAETGRPASAPEWQGTWNTCFRSCVRCRRLEARLPLRTAPE